MFKHKDLIFAGFLLVSAGLARSFWNNSFTNMAVMASTITAIYLVNEPYLRKIFERANEKPADKEDAV